MLNRLIRHIKGSNTYTLDKDLKKIDLFIILKQRLSQFIRGFFKKIFLNKSKGVMFVGSNVKIHHANKFVSGKGLIVEDNVYINALSKQGVFVGNNVTIQRGCTIVCTGVIRDLGEGVTIGNNVGLNIGCYIAGQGGVVIGNSVIIGPNVKIFSENHIFSDINCLIKDQGETRKKVQIGDNCWLGAGVTVLAGVNIGQGCVVAAGAVVTKSFGDNLILGGVPAKIINNRK